MIPIHHETFSLGWNPTRHTEKHHAEAHDRTGLADHVRILNIGEQIIVKE